MTDGFVKSGAPIATKYAMGRAALRCILRHCGVATSTPHSSGFARLAYGAFYEAVSHSSPLSSKAIPYRGT